MVLRMRVAVKMIAPIYGQRDKKRLIVGGQSLEAALSPD
jgi:hypothetical protein